MAPHPPRPVAYLVNQYPKVSHSFIRREIEALEQAGQPVLRVAARGWRDAVVDAGDLRERASTRYLLDGGAGPLLVATLAQAARAPLRFLAAVRTTLAIGRRADRPWAAHLVYLAEACLLLRWMRDAGASHLHAHFGTNPAAVALLAKVLGGDAVSYSFTVHGPEEFDKPAAIALAQKVRHSAFTVAISAYGRSQLYRWLDAADWPRVKVVHCGLDAQFLDAQPTPVPEARRLVCVGRLCEQKGQLLLVEAMRVLRDEGVALELVLAGDGELRAPIEAQIAAHGLGSCIRITGWVPSGEVLRLIGDSRAMVLPSFAEGLPVAIMEALALGRPVLTTTVAGIPELVRDGECGWLVAPGSCEALVDALRRFALTPTAQIAAMGARGRERVRERHDVRREAARLARLFGDPSLPGWPA